MRGTIIMWSGDKGVITAGGQRYDFDINHWQGATAPAANMTVEVTVTDGKLAGVTPVNEADLAKEKLAAMTGKGGEVAKAVFANVGKDVAIAYGVFLITALFIGVNSSSGGIIECSITLANMLSGGMAMLSACMGGGGSGKGIFLVLLATATIAVPYFWKHKFAPLAFLGPLLITLVAVKPLWDRHRAAKQAADAMAAQMAEFARTFGQMAQQAPETPGFFDNAGLGAWIIIAAVLYLAFKGVMKFLGRA